MKKYRTILIDPPWPERGGGKIKRGADKHYPVLSVKDIPRAIWMSGVFEPNADAHLYLWCTNNYLPQALGMVFTLGFRYITKITWAKDRPGLGQYFRGQTEDLLFAVRGSGFAVNTDRRDLTTLIEAPRRRHSQKPNEVYDLIEARSRGPYLEMFARSRRENWDSWGNEI